ncbi:MAG TPA: hypothetical protein VJ779_07175 [Acetobacteraceae bacterium]|nr:hypothetical protein [Acetobacteraceae bacterium]
MTYDDFDVWLDAVRALSPVPVAANDRWYDAFLCALDPHLAVRLVGPDRAEGRGASLWLALKRFFD